MVAVESTTASVSGVTLVGCRVRNSTTDPYRVRLRNELDAPVLAPRRRGRPESGWTEHGYEGTIAPGERRTLGYACRATATTPPVRIVRRERVAEMSIDARSVVDQLADPRPPQPAVPPGKGGNGDEAETPSIGRDELDRIESRIADCERLAAATTVAEATRALDRIGGLAELDALLRRLEEDRAALESHGGYGGEIAERAAIVRSAVAVERLEAIA